MTPPILEASPVLHGLRTRTLAVDGDGPSILLLPGLTDSADSWRPLLAELGTRGRRAVAVDLPGAGKAGTFSGGIRLANLDASPPRSSRLTRVTSQRSSPATRSAGCWRCAPRPATTTG
jgi:pimeloyl-ACP methyl ester carboxylesterase